MRAALGALALGALGALRAALEGALGGSCGASFGVAMWKHKMKDLVPYDKNQGGP